MPPLERRAQQLALGEHRVRHQAELGSTTHTRRPTTTGVVRLVLAHVNPGVPNWLDVAGHREGALCVRYLLAGARPPVEVRTVKLAELRNHLAADTPALSPADRAKMLAARQHAKRGASGADITGRRPELRATIPSSRRKRRPVHPIPSAE